MIGRRDGRNVKDLNIKWLRGHIGIVGQEPALFDCSITENIRYAKADATDQEVQEACREANAYNFIKNLPNVSPLRWNVLGRTSIDVGSDV